MFFLFFVIVCFGVFVCSGRGFCSDKISGNGLCICEVRMKRLFLMFSLLFVVC